MKIIGCFISGFGCYLNERVSFQEGVHTVLRENGQGKTTLQAFLRVMLYGFKNEEKRNKAERERERMRPWHGGAYGGSLDLEAGGKRYRIERSFGKKSAEDELKVYDLSTNLLTDTLGTDPGLALFGVDVETFERTVFVSHETVRTAVSGAIHQKLGNLVEDTLDVNRYEEANQTLTAMLNQYSETRSTGVVYKLKNRIAKLTEEVSSYEAVEANLAREEQAERALKSEKELLLQKRKELTSKQNALSGYQSVVEGRTRYETLKETLSEREETEKRLRVTFPDGAPDFDEIDRAKEDLQEYESKTALLNEERLSDRERTELEEYEKTFSGTLVTAEEGERVLGLSDKLRETEEALNEGRMIEKSRTASVLLLIAGLILAGSSILVFTGSNIENAFNFLSIGPEGDVIRMAVGLIAVLLGLVTFFGTRVKEKRLLPIEREADRKATSIRSYLARLEGTRRNAEEELNSFLNRFGREFNPQSAGMEIAGLLRDQDAYRSLKKKEERYKGYFTAANRALSEVKAFLNRYPAFSSRGDDREKLKALSDEANRLKAAKEETKRAKAQLKQFELDTDLRALLQTKKPDFPENMEELNRLQEETRSASDRIQEEEIAHGREIERLRSRLEEMDEASEELRRESERIGKLREQLSVLADAKAYLEEAKRSLSGKYTSAVTEKFRRYVKEILGEDDGLRFDITADGDAVIEERGVLREAELFSSGYQVLTYFCMRIALVEAMYEEEKPVLFLDDPFAELDEKKTEQALKLLRKIGEHYQVLYFTCHPSRT